MALSMLLLCGVAPSYAAPAATVTTLTVTSAGSGAVQVKSGALVTFTATVKAGDTAVTTGRVQFCDAAAALCTDVHLLGTQQLTAQGTATLNLRPGIGSHSYIAVFAGTTSHAASSSAPAVLAVTGTYPTTAVLAAQVVDGKYTLTATVKGTGGLAPPSGSVTFLDTTDGDRELGKAELGTATTQTTLQPIDNVTALYPPTYLAAGDFNGDGRDDLFVAYESMELGTVLLANPDGTFSTAAESPTTGNQPWAVATADFNNDGKTDVAVTNLTGDVVEILQGNGDGTFTPVSQPSTGSGPMSMAVGDFNGDGNADLAVANQGSNNVTILLGNGDGTFTAAKQTPATDASPSAIVAADFDGDGKTDLAVANSTGETITVLLGNGDGSFSPAETVSFQNLNFGSPMGIAAGDFAGNGKLDLAVLCGAAVVILRGNGDGTFTAGQNLAATGSYFAEGDFNGDGRADLVVDEPDGPANIDDTVTLLLGNGDGTFTAQTPRQIARNLQPYLYVPGHFTASPATGLAYTNYDTSGIDDMVSMAVPQTMQTATAAVSGISFDSTGRHLIEASYAGDATHSASISNKVSALPVAAPPKLSPAGGKYTRPQKVTITDSTPGAAIYYALHGATPGTHSARYSTPLEVESTESVEAIAAASGYSNSTVTRGDFTIDELQTAEPEFLPAGGVYGKEQKVAIADKTPDASIYYTMDGSVPTLTSTKYTGRIPVTGKETLRAIAEAPDYKPSKVSSAGYAIDLPAAAPVFHPGGGSYATAQTVTIEDESPGAQIYYTANGSTPTPDSKRYTGPLIISVSPKIQVLKAIAAGPGFAPSAVTTARYTITPVVATPVFYPAAGTYSSPITVTITDTTANSTIYYTTDGSMPAPSSTKYTAPVNVSANETLKAIAVSGANPSAIGLAAYVITAGVTAAPIFSTTPEHHGAVLVGLATTTPGATIYYTLDGTVPSTSSAVYLAPFLVASKLTVKAKAVTHGFADSPVITEVFNTGIPSGTLVWSDEFSNSTGANAQPNPLVWTYDSGDSGFGNDELENYCAWGANASPCNSAAPNAYVGTDGYLHIVARRPSPGVYTSARLKTQGLFSFRYGRMEVRAMVPEAQGFWPAAWTLGNNIATADWPDCGEQDDLERVDARATPDWNEGSVHGPGFIGGDIGMRYDFPAGQSAAQWHNYGMIWSPGKVEYYVDDPAQPYATFTPDSLSSLPDASWPFDAGQSNFIILNLAIGGDYPGPPDSSTPFPSEYLVDYVRIYAN
jgi:beta-glucanase (GH16 family)